MWAIENSWWEQSYEIFNKLKKLTTHLCRAIKIEQVETSLHDAAAEGHLEICKLICENASNLNSKCFDCGMTPLHQAAIEGHLEFSRHAAAREGLLKIYKFIAERN